MKLKILFLFLALCIFDFSNCAAQQKHTFDIKDGFFLYDGKPVNIHAGQIDFARIPRPYWQRSLKMLKAMGMNSVATYVFWNYQETAPGVWDFRTDNRDIVRFIRLAQQEGLFVILRPGPYTCAEWEFGGFPWWLQKNKDLVLRTNNKSFLDSCKTYINKLAGQIKELQITHGGPVILVQVENEFGSYVSQRPDIPLSDDKAYLRAIRQDLVQAGIDVPLFTADGSNEFKGGTTEGVLPTANGERDIDFLKKIVGEYHDGRGPYLIGEFYTGSLDHWKEPFRRVASDKLIRQLDIYLKAGVSFSFYMAQGGTLFGFTSGANYNKKDPIQPDMTSYDYDAPITEAGRATPKFKAVRDEMARFITGPLPDIPSITAPIFIPRIRLNKVVDLFDLKEKIRPVVNDTAMSFEDLNQGYGYVLYSRKFTRPLQGDLVLAGLRDYAQIYVNGRFLAVLNRADSIFSCAVDIPASATLDILVENMGRINYDAEIVHNLKGIISPVIINGRTISGNWEMYRFPFSHPPDLSKLRNRNIRDHPTVYAGEFTLVKTGDTFLDMNSWGKGIVFVNGHNLGRYWNVGPQQTLYLPGCWLMKGENSILIFEQQNAQKHTDITALQAPVLDQLRK
ncbi:MAG: beta-galactosidase [Bacteroidota bacterium]|nr:beta-galactosidase [Bacteroidota bacterium]